MLLVTKKLIPILQILIFFSTVSVDFRTQACEANKLYSSAKSLFMTTPDGLKKFNWKIRRLAKHYIPLNQFSNNLDLFTPHTAINEVGASASRLPRYKTTIGDSEVYLLSKLKAGDQLHKQKRFLHEISMYKKLDKLGIGPKYYGITVIDDNLYIVLELIYPSLFFKYSLSEEAIKSFSIANNRNTEWLVARWITELDAIKETLIVNKIHTNDLQVLLTPEGAVKVIDPEFFRQGSRYSQPNAEGVSKMIEKIKSIYD